MTRRYGLVVRLFGLALLLLAVSPLTAPFSTCDPLDLFGGAPAPAPAAVQSKTHADEPVAEVGSLPGLDPILLTTLQIHAVRSLRVRVVIPRDVPLRL